MTPSQIEDTIRGAAALTAAIAARNPDDAEAVLGPGPAWCLALWLADTLVRVGRPLQAGDTVLTGALGPMVTPAPGDVLEARIDGLGDVRVAFGKES